MRSKLVRDNIPTIINRSGKIAVTHIADKDELKSATVAKLYEEISEFEEAPSLEEAADIYQVFMALLTAYDMTFDSVIKVAVDKMQLMAGFDKKIILDDIING